MAECAEFELQLNSQICNLLYNFECIICKIMRVYMYIHVYMFIFTQNTLFFQINFRRKSGSVSHSEPARVENFGVFGEVHVQAAVIVERHGYFLQRLVSAVRTEHFVHVARRPNGKNTKDHRSSGL